MEFGLVIKRDEEGQLEGTPNDEAEGDRERWTECSPKRSHIFPNVQSAF